MKDFIQACDVPVSIYDRIQQTADYELYLTDCYWIFVINGYYEFYYNPCLFMGKIKQEDMPPSVKDRIQFLCINTRRLSKDRAPYLVPSNKRIRHFENNMRIGNWFSCLGQNFITNRGTFIADDMYVADNERECPLRFITWEVVERMLKMAVQTRTPYYIQSVFDLDIFHDVPRGSIDVHPFAGKGMSAKSWKEKFDRSVKFEEFGLVRKLRAEIFQDTVTAVKKGQYTSENGALVELPDDGKMIMGTEFYKKELPSIENVPCRYNTEVEILNMDTCLAAKKLTDEGLRPVALNMASRQNPGGGVYTGAGAQEENLFRRSNLFRSMFQFASYAAEYGLRKSPDQYPLDHNFGGVYTPRACVFRGTEDEGYPLLEKPYLVDFVAVAAINNPELDPKGQIIPSLVEATKRKIRTIFRIAYTKGHDSLVLGAFGCGAFRNPPYQVARIFREVLEEDEFKGLFRKVVFAILDDHNAHLKHNPEGNFIPFQKVFADFNKEAE